MSDFVEGAHCRHYDLELFYPAKSDLAGISRAKTVCQGCPALEECLILALEVLDRDAVMGGMSPVERDRFLARFHHNQERAVNAVKQGGRRGSAAPAHRGI